MREYMCSREKTTPLVVYKTASFWASGDLWRKTLSQEISDDICGI